MRVFELAVARERFNAPVSETLDSYEPRERIGIPRAAATRGNDRRGAYSLSLSFSRAWLPRVKNPGLSPAHDPHKESLIKRD